MPVVADGKLVGVITTTDIARTGGPSDQVQAADAMTPRPTTVTPNSPVSEALERMASLGVGIIPVVADDDPRRLVGLGSRSSCLVGEGFSFFRVLLAGAAAACPHGDHKRQENRQSKTLLYQSFPHHLSPLFVRNGLRVHKAALI